MRFLRQRLVGLVEGHDLAIDAGLAHAPRDQLGDLAAEIQNQNAHGCRRSPWIALAARVVAMVQRGHGPWSRRPRPDRCASACVVEIAREIGLAGLGIDVAQRDIGGGPRRIGDDGRLRQAHRQFISPLAMAACAWPIRSEAESEGVGATTGAAGFTTARLGRSGQCGRGDQGQCQDQEMRGKFHGVTLVKSAGASYASNKQGIWPGCRALPMKIPRENRQLRENGPQTAYGPPV